MIKTLSKKRFLRVLAIFLAVNLLVNTIYIPTAFALTSGPSQPEVQSFEPIGTSEMVNLFTGDFTYNIPLFELPGPNGGYPFNMAYNGGVGMDQEASWVGLGWNLQPGSVSRSIMGMPDEFDGDEVYKKMDIKPDVTVGVGRELGFEAFGIKNIASGNFTIQETIYANSYRGFSFERRFGVGLSAQLLENVPLKAELNGGISFNSQNGIDINGGGSIGLSKRLDIHDQNGIALNLTADIGFNYNSRRGLQNITTGLGASAQLTQESYTKKNEDGSTTEMKRGNGLTTGLSPSMTVSLLTANSGYSPQISMPFKSTNIALDIKRGQGIPLVPILIYPGGSLTGLNGSFSVQKLANKGKWVKSKAFGYENMQNATKDDLLDYNREKDATVRDGAPNLWMPKLTYDSYSVMGQGMMGAFRPYRNDIGTVWDQYMESTSFGFTAGAEFGKDGTWGANAGVNKAYSRSTPWSQIVDAVDPDNPDSNNNLGLSFKANTTEEQYTYFKAHGEPTSKPQNAWSHLGGYDPLYIPLKKPSSKKDNVTAENRFTNGKGFSTAIPAERKILKDEQEVRNSIVLPVKNEDLLKTVRDLSGTRTEEILKEFQISYYPETANPNDWNVPMVPYDRRTREEGSNENKVIRNAAHHLAGFANIDPSGLRYVYGLPAYNKSQVDCQFSALAKPAKDIIELPTKSGGTALDYGKEASTDKYLSQSKTPAHAYAYMLTSVLGVDYVDADNIPGPSDGDLGYWVKFNYRKISDNFKWRAPFAGAKYTPGIKNTDKDDRASYSYGEKEVWHLATAETQSHIARFYIEQREDARGAIKELQRLDNTLTSTNSGYSYKLAKVELFSKLELANPTGLDGVAVPIKVVHFNYNGNQPDGQNTPFSLCQGVNNNASTGAESGKLTLTGLWFQYGLNTIGRHTPYKFEYGLLHAEDGSRLQDNDGVDVPPVNPNYEPSHADRWGNYRNPDDVTLSNLVALDRTFLQLDFPYVDQLTPREKLDRDATAWNLTDITLPSGAKIKVDYEADDYAYVQNKEAMYMTEIVGVGEEISDVFTSNGELKGTALERMRLTNQTQKVFFKLKNPVKITNSAQDQYNEIIKYVDKTKTDEWQLYFKAEIALQGPNVTRLREFVGGYATLERFFNITHIGDRGGLVGKQVIDGEEYYTHGYLKVKKVNEKYHPFSLAAWQHIQVNQPHLYTGNADLSEGMGISNIISTINAMINPSYLEEIKQMVRGFYNWAGSSSRNWGRQMTPGKSWIRLNVSDGKKVGGGLRVKKVALYDEWDLTKYSDSDNIQVKPARYGQVYKYTTTNERGEEISSGVAAYEPLFGGDEIAIRTAETYEEKVPMRNNNTFFFENPINESYYPGPQVGYSQVTVRSLASDNAENQAIGSVKGFHNTTGETIHEYFTAKDFPILYASTNKHKTDYFPKPYTKLKLLINSKMYQHMASSQGFSIIQNNMHGQQKKVSNYEMDSEGNLNPNPISWVEYHYKEGKETTINGRKAKTLDNVVDALGNYENGTPVVGEDNMSIEKRIIGEEMDFFVDARETRNKSTSDGGGINFYPAPNFGVPWLFLLIPVPSFSRNVQSTRTVVTNKVISRIGIMEKTTAYNNGSYITTANEVWDGQTGEVVLSSVNNNFEEKIYSYNIPAHLKYDGIGAAYKNIGTRFSAAFTKMVQTPDTNPTDEVDDAVYRAKHFIINTDGMSDFLKESFYPGDEFLVSADGAAYTKAIFVGTSRPNPDAAPQFIFYTVDDLGDVNYDLFRYRSGRRNLLTAKVGSITSKSDPLRERTADPNPKNLPAVEIPDCPRGDCLGNIGEKHPNPDEND